MIVKELIEKLKEFDEDLEVYVDIHKEVIWCGGENLNDGIPYKYIDDVESGYKINWNGPNKPCIILS